MRNGFFQASDNGRRREVSRGDLQTGPGRDPRQATHAPHETAGRQLRDRGEDQGCHAVPQRVPMREEGPRIDDQACRRDAFWVLIKCSRVCI